VLFLSARQTIEVVNNQTGTGAAYVTFYEYYCTKNVAVATMDDILSSSAPAPGMSGMANTQLGATPFDFNPVTQNIKITRITEMAITPGASQLFEWKDSKRKIWNNQCAQQFQIGTTCSRAGWTKGVLAVTTGQGSGTHLAEIASVSFIVNNHYTVKFDPNFITGANIDSSGTF
jgi:hypothetical protein